MATLEAIVGGTTYNLNDGTYVYWTGEAGTGNSPSRRVTEQGPLQHGDIDVDMRLDPRVFQEAFIITPASLSEHYTKRAALLRIFRPSATRMQMRWTLDNGDVRQIDCVVIGGPDFASSERQGFAQRMVVQFRAADPTFYDPVPIGVTYGVGGGSGGFVVPMVVPMGVGASTVNQLRTITYDGNWRDFPIITITGPITDCVITNTSTGDVLDLTGTSIAGGDSYTIDLRYGHKTVTDAAGDNKIANLTDDSDLATFSLEPDPDVPGGNNSITVTGTGATTATEIYLQYTNRYVGI